MAKFAQGDTFMVKENGNYGYIDHVGFNSIYQYTEYYVKWATLSGMHCYMSDAVDDRWEKVVNLPAGYSVDFSALNGTIDLSCAHEWVVYNSGFTTMEYCKKCNIDKP